MLRLINAKLALRRLRRDVARDLKLLVEAVRGAGAPVEVDDVLHPPVPSDHPSNLCRCEGRGRAGDLPYGEHELGCQWYALMCHRCQGTGYCNGCGGDGVATGGD